jgi:L-alanine-DL-glutamate epimerase-like enolase superfamily enzyme
MITRRRMFRGLFSGVAGGAAGAALTAFSGTEGLMAQNAEKARSLNLKITGLKTFLVAPDGVYVKIYTNQGLIGLGQAHVDTKEPATAQAIMDNEPLLIGADPTQISKIWQALYLNPQWRGGPILNSAISAIDIALWDILGQSLSLPIYQLLGGAVRSKIRCYSGGGDTTPESWAKIKAQGFTATRTNARGKSVSEMIEYVKALRKAAGPDHDLAIHFQGTFTTPEAVTFMRGVEECNLFFVEEPIPAIEDLKEWTFLRSHTTTPIATGERMTTKYMFTPFLENHFMDYAQPDLCIAGGYTELKKIAAIAEAYRIQVATHNPHGPVGAMATFHFDAATTNFAIQELREYNTQYNMDLHDGMIPIVKDGHGQLPEKPGLGTVLNEKVAAKFPYKPYVHGTVDSPFAEGIHGVPGNPDSIGGRSAGPGRNE